MNRDESPLTVDVSDDRAHEGVVDVAEVLCEERDGRAHVVEVDAEVEDYEAGVGGGSVAARCGECVVVGAVGVGGGFVVVVIDHVVVHSAVLVGVEGGLHVCYRGFYAVVEVGHHFDDAFVVVARDGDVGDDVDVAFLDPAEGSVDASVEMVYPETVEADSALFLPLARVADRGTSVHCNAGVAMCLNGVDCEEGVVK